MKTLYRITLCVALLALVVVPASAQMIGQGTDLWRTRGDGSTFASFALDPIPAGFFCAGSAAFTGKIAFEGVPVATEPSGVLNLTDTVIERLDDAVFNENGVATTRIQMAAMQFKGVEPFRNECGTFEVGVELDGKQPITEMKIIRERAFGGRFLADIHVNVRITFTPMDHGGETLEVGRELRFGPAANATWARRPDPGFTEFDGVVKVDSDADGTPDRFVPGTSSNFFAGARGAAFQGGVLHRADPVQASGDEVSGSLKDPSGAVLTPGVKNTAGGATSVEEKSVLCHVDDGCGHCTDGTTYTL